MELWLLRHARARAARPEEEDQERALAEAGCEQARALNQWIKASGRQLPSTILVSPAERTLQTAELVLQGLETSEPVIEPALWEALEEDLLGLLKQHEDKEDLLIIGHNPGLEWLVQWLTGQRPRLGMKSGTLVIIEAQLPAEPRCGEILELVQESDLM